MVLEIIIVSLIVFLGSFTQGLTGFGLALVSVPLLSLTIGVKSAVPVAGVFGWLATFPIIWKMRQHVKWKIGLILFLGSLPGTIIGADLLKHMPVEILLITMGVVLITSSIYSLSSKKLILKNKSIGITLTTGFFSGALGASVGEPGPPVIAYTAMQPWSADQIKSTLLFFFMLTLTGAIIVFWQKGLLTNEVIKYIQIAIPACLIGMTVGVLSYYQLHRFNINYHHIVHWFLLFIGLTLIFNNLII